MALNVLVLSKEKKSTNRMSWRDYIVICVQQSQLRIGATDVPYSFIDLCDGIDARRFTPEPYNAGADLADKLFGRWPYNEDGDRLYKVEELSIEESAIAARLDLSHDEKIELIKPLREACEKSSVAQLGSPLRRERGTTNRSEPINECIAPFPIN
jgi:hypothetical protein